MNTKMRKFNDLEDELHKAASHETGLDDFGDPGYRQGLRAVLDAYDTDLQLTEPGWRLAYGGILDTLTARLYTQKGWAEHPEVLTIPIQRPLVITGFPRTGTTALHKLLSLDPQFQGLECWLAQAPMIRPPRETWETHPAYRTCVARLDAMFTVVPEMRKAHDYVAGELEECGAVLWQSFVLSGPALLLPTYRRWLLTQSERESYSRYVDVLRLIGGRDAHKRWLLKAPHHMFEIGTLINVFPDACIVLTHRDPLKVIPSVCSLFHMMDRTWQGGAARTDVLGSLMCTYWREALDRTQAWRQRLPKQFFDVDHRRFLSEPLGMIRSIYDYFGLALSSHIEQQMRAWVAASPTTRHGEHRYTIDPYGITEAQICNTFAEYRVQHQFT